MNIKGCEVLLKGDKLVGDFIESMYDIINTYEKNSIRIENYNKITDDILHEIEFSRYNIIQRSEVYDRIRSVRRERRACVEENKHIRPLYKFLIGEDIKSRIAQLEMDCYTSKETILSQGYSPKYKDDNRVLSSEDINRMGKKWKYERIMGEEILNSYDKIYSFPKTELLSDINNKLKQLKTMWKIVHMDEVNKIFKCARRINNEY